jgi:hypothetical protein
MGWRRKWSCSQLSMPRGAAGSGISVAGRLLEVNRPWPRCLLHASAEGGHPPANNLVDLNLQRSLGAPGNADDACLVTLLALRIYCRAPSLLSTSTHLPRIRSRGAPEACQTRQVSGAWSLTRQRMATPRQAHCNFVERSASNSDSSRDWGMAVRHRWLK